MKYDYFFPAQFLIFSGFNVCFAYSYVCFSLIYFLLNSKFGISIPTSGSLVFFRCTDNPVRFSRGALSRGRYTSSHSRLPFVLGVQLCPRIDLRQLFGHSLDFCPLWSPQSPGDHVFSLALVCCLLGGCIFSQLPRKRHMGR